MKIIFFGLGSIGQRHANILLKDYTHDLYAFRSSAKSKPNELGIKELYSWDELEKLKPDVAFITNPTSLHIETAIKCAEFGCKLFIEKPIGSSLKDFEKLKKIVKSKKIVTYIAYNLRFHPIILKLKKNIENKKILHARVVCTSYLPTWRPDRDFLKGYSANTNMGGGVILDLSHELDYISYLLGDINKMTGTYSKRSNVTVDAEDFVDYLLETKTTPVNIHINFLSQLRQRYIQIDFDQLTIIADLIDSEIREYKNDILHKTEKVDYQKGQEYSDQIKYFLDNIDNPSMMNNLSEASGLFEKITAFKNHE
ncbi:hypothetical protein A3C59_00465 [Candidatus Daviesbacteria bacterium RIFCSPHIGHO2_02_FULL_36_13]|uniref:Uncharacterized protein n=1 Tax=Candidatus Daviesbacteria bacterium RIFCSPHIGHO2_02_FULL_36_13 TaxID=1797768 RepID=A0A1F5JP53_9BACT|nr:MAG: hypothetical protein A3C59_00465 [Candidatus Daviesbacteria bacterium RIFCSPHIGHO2_02_FULL_36_13]OGE43772.1 MAG: hypothetical protein A3A45_00240 [Candidatus Daviesbacteria bacterium RIFCSPLOWO2_01_FULL_36_8]